jgi:hypothetical protein
MKSNLRSVALIILFGLVLLTAAIRPAPALAEDVVNKSTTEATPAATAAAPLADAGKPLLTEIARRRFLPPPPRVLLPEDVKQEDVVQRPFLYWRAWANQKLPLPRVEIFLTLMISLVELIMPTLVIESTATYRQKWLRSFGIGCLFFTVGMFAGATLARMGLYAPLATVTIAAVQLVSMIGMAVAARAIGSRITSFLHFERFIKHEGWRNWISLWLGGFILALVTLIPGFGSLPRVGNRMFALISAAGTGAFIMTAKARRR